VPLAKFSVAVRGYTVDDADMLCLDLFVDFVSGLVLSRAESKVSHLVGTRIQRLIWMLMLAR
jgi:hypothetical protein